MKKVILILLVAFVFFATTNTVSAEDYTLDIEKIAIETIKNSQALDTYSKQVTMAQKNYGNVMESIGSARQSLVYRNSYQTVESIILTPMQMKNILDEVTNGQQVATNAVRLSAYQSYIALLKSGYDLNIKQDLMNGLEADYKQAKLKQSLGQLTQSELRLSEIAYLKAQYNYKSAQNTYNSAYMSLNKLMNENLEKQYSTLQDDNIIPAPEIKQLSDYINLALTSRSEVINAQNTLDYKKKAYDYAKAEYPPPSDIKLYTQQQQYAIDSAQNALDIAKISVQQDIITLYKSLSGAYKNMEAMKNLDNQAAVSFRAAEVKFKNGQISQQDFEDAKVSKAQAHMNNKNAQLDAWLAQTTMDYACGFGYKPSSSTSSSS
ncbi:TolC family protein [Dehalobacter sp.]|uniref:TolC family protein n=1 Tax=Dehalobacter sp. TaxID=1962289 RepID=UPI00258CF614|nr:TolC family protein [Dehalobacter sp.]MCG1024854.1 TolC family protein [Dehalobacter sp.]